MASYPAAIAALTTADADNTASATNHKNDHNNANGEINAIETELGILPKGNSANLVQRLDGTGPEFGNEGLRAALYRTAGQTPTLKAQNFELWTVQNATLSEAAMTSQRNNYMAIWWPGGAPTGIVWMTAVAGNYTDAGTHSGFQLLGGSASTPVTSATTTLTRITNSNTTAAPASMWNAAAGMNNKAFGAAVANLAAGIYYVNTFYSQSAVVANPELAIFQSSGADYFNKAGYGSPSGFPLYAGKNADTDLQSSALISGLTTTFTNYFWIGLY